MSLGEAAFFSPGASGYLRTVCWPHALPPRSDLPPEWGSGKCVQRALQSTPLVFSATAAPPGSQGASVLEETSNRKVKGTNCCWATASGEASPCAPGEAVEGNLSLDGRAHPGQGRILEQVP